MYRGWPNIPGGGPSLAQHWLSMVTVRSLSLPVCTTGPDTISEVGESLDDSVYRPSLSRPSQNRPTMVARPTMVDRPIIVDHPAIVLL